MRESVKIIQQALDGMPGRAHQGRRAQDRAARPRKDEDPDGSADPSLQDRDRRLRGPAGEVYQGIECGHGQTGYYVVSDGTAKPYRVHMRYPSFATLQALETMCKGG